MNEQAIIAAYTLPYVCGKHPDVELILRLKGGAGWCSQCRCYVQSANHQMPERVIARPSAKVAAKAKRARKVKAKAATEKLSKRTTKQRKKVTAPARSSAA